ncbi:MAG: excinuclease ABC subunit UvrC [Methylococcales bacterium]|nr:excinuclease ABC subunit UvrC [Methylococcales bacterium]MBT7443520.1 excinuclease ABC subunit UvrC [Methylococcales bacterium]
MSEETPSFDAQAFLNNLTQRPGVYQMINAANKIIYVGKAKNLKKRVSSYFNRPQGTKVTVMVSQIADVQIIITNTESEALILECQLIKQHRPRYNVLLRDDKSYPYIHLSEHEFPKLGLYRGSKKESGQYFGPYPSAHAVRETLNILQKIFPVRQCEDGFYAHRNRPCLQHQIERCSAPCVGLVRHQDYQEDIRHAILFLQGKSSEVVEELASKMDQVASELNFEKAAFYRDQISNLRKVQEQQYVSGEKGNLDILSCVQAAETCCIQVFFIRNGLNLGNKTYFIKVPNDMSEGDLLASFIPQYYLDKQVPDSLIVSHDIPQQEWILTTLSEIAKRNIHLVSQPRGERAQWLKLANTNAQMSLSTKLASQSGYQQQLSQLQQILKLDNPPKRIDCFDISHTQGELTVASCVVFGSEGALKSDYRRFNINGITPGDDYAAMNQALTRHYSKLVTNTEKRPEILLIDGGKGQVSEALAVLEELQIQGVLVVGVAKGPERKVGHEGLVIPGQSELLYLGPHSPALHLIATVRDEAHRFAITSHRNRRDKKRKTSVLESIAGLGPNRRQQILRHFGGLQGVQNASAEDLAKVKGISHALAEKIYDVFHSS